MISPFAKRPRTAVELFAGGAGGWALGLHWAGVEVAVAVEKDLERRMAHFFRWGHPVLADVKAIHGGILRTMFFNGRRPWLVCGSPPCKGISEVNSKGKGVDDDGLFFEAIRVAVEAGAVWISFENVARLRSRGADRVIAMLEAAGYACWPVVVGSDLAGKDHERPRVVIVAASPDATRRKGRFARQPWAAPFCPASRRPDIVGRPGDCRPGVGDLRPETLGRHVRAYDAVSDRVAEFARRAYGDSFDPIFPYLIAKALIDWETGEGAPKPLFRWPKWLALDHPDDVARRAQPAGIL